MKKDRKEPNTTPATETMSRWGPEEDQIRWALISLPMGEGGLGIRNSGTTNEVAHLAS